MVGFERGFKTKSTIQCHNINLRSVGSMANTVEDVLRGPDHKVLKGIQAGIDACNRQAVSNAQKIQKWMILPRDFSLDGGEITPTMKVSYFNQFLTIFWHCHL